MTWDAFVSDLLAQLPAVGVIVLMFDRRLRAVERTLGTLCGQTKPPPPAKDAGGGGGTDDTLRIVR